MQWAGKQALRDRYGEGRYATVAAHVERWGQFAAWAQEVLELRDARNIDATTLAAYGQSLADKVRQAALSVSYAQNMLSTVNVVLEALRGARVLRLSPAAFVGRRAHVRTEPPIGLDRSAVRQCGDRLRARTRANRRHLNVYRRLSMTNPANQKAAGRQTRALLARRLPGSRRGTVAAHLTRAERIGAAIWRRWQIGPYRWQLKNVRWFLSAQTEGFSASTRYRYWLTVRALVSALGHGDDWIRRIEGPWVRPTGSDGTMSRQIRDLRPGPLDNRTGGRP